MKQDDTLVSIIVPVYGTEAYLPACIESIQNQSYTNIQIILVDDQSPDRCPEICDSYAQKDPRIQVIHQNNKGVSGARNTGLRHAAGAYTMFVDSDDLLYPDAVEVLMQDVSEYKADIVCATAKVVDEYKGIVDDYADGSHIVLEKHQLMLYSLEGSPYTGSACVKLFKTGVICDVKFVEGKDINEDSYFMFQCSLKEPRVVLHNVAVYQYNTRSGSNSRQKFSDKYLSMIYFCEQKKKLVAEYYPQYMEQAHNMEARTNLQLLDVLCSTVEKKYRTLEKQCVQTVRRLYRYHKPINEHHKLLAWIVKHRLYPLYKWAVRMKCYR